MGLHGQAHETCMYKEDINVSMARMCRKLEAGTHVLVTI